MYLANGKVPYDKLPANGSKQWISWDVLELYVDLFGLFYEVWRSDVSMFEFLMSFSIFSNKRNRCLMTV